MVFDIEKMRQDGNLRIGDYVETVDGVCGVVTQIFYSGETELPVWVEASLCGNCIIRFPVIDIPKNFVRVGQWTSEEWKKPPMQQREKHFSATLEPWKHPFRMPQKPDKVPIFRSEVALDAETRQSWEEYIARGIERGAVLLPEFIKLETVMGKEG